MSVRMPFALASFHRVCQTGVRPVSHEAIKGRASSGMCDRAGPGGGFGLDLCVCVCVVWVINKRKLRGTNNVPLLVPSLGPPPLCSLPLPWTTRSIRKSSTSLETSLVSSRLQTVSQMKYLWSDLSDNQAQLSAFFWITGGKYDVSSLWGLNSDSVDFLKAAET